MSRPVVYPVQVDPRTGRPMVCDACHAATDETMCPNDRRTCVDCCPCHASDLLPLVTGRTDVAVVSFVSALGSRRVRLTAADGRVVIVERQAVAHGGRPAWWCARGVESGPLIASRVSMRAAIVAGRSFLRLDVVDPAIVADLDRKALRVERGAL